MKVSIVRILVAASLAIAFCVAPALADSFTLHNKTSHEMVKLFVSPTSKADWGPNLLEGTVPAGQDATFTWSKDASDECNWDVRGEYADGSYAEVKNVDFCTVTEVTFTD
ncbi:MAG: hypothetical protein JO199_10315 [Candidatus Eremiobacteraeota bacterium]|nr:hypothetical protein [Candidatus Eremiobacteraeota bacterium]